MGYCVEGPVPGAFNDMVGERKKVLMAAVSHGRDYKVDRVDWVRGSSPWKAVPWMMMNNSSPLLRNIHLLRQKTLPPDQVKAVQDELSDQLTSLIQPYETYDELITKNGLRS